MGVTFFMLVSDVEVCGRNGAVGSASVRIGESAASSPHPDTYSQLDYLSIVLSIRIADVKRGSASEHIPRCRASFKYEDPNGKVSRRAAEETGCSLLLCCSV